MKLVCQRLDKKHKEYKEGKKVIKGIIKRQQFRGNVIPWCQFASFELETSSLPEVIQEIYLQALQLAWSLKQKSNLQKGIFRNTTHAKYFTHVIKKPSRQFEQPF